MIPALDFALLPSVPLPDRDRLPQCPGIYFAIDAHDRVLYIGRAANLLGRWKGRQHHRLEQLTRMQQLTESFAFRLDCSGAVNSLASKIRLDESGSGELTMQRPPSSPTGDRFALNPKRAAELLDISVDTLDRYRTDAKVGWIQGVHWFQLPKGGYRHNRELLEGWLANLHDLAEHQKAVLNFRNSLLSSQRRRRTA